MNLHLFRALCPNSLYDWAALPISVFGYQYQLIVPASIADTILTALNESSCFRCIKPGEQLYAMHDLGEIDFHAGGEPAFMVREDVKSTYVEASPSSGTVRSLVVNQSAATEILRLARCTTYFDDELSEALHCYAPYFLNSGGFELVSVLQEDVAEALARELQVSKRRLLRDESRLTFKAFLVTNCL